MAENTEGAPKAGVESAQEALAAFRTYFLQQQQGPDLREEGPSAHVEEVLYELMDYERGQEVRGQFMEETSGRGARFTPFSTDFFVYSLLAGKLPKKSTLDESPRYSINGLSFPVRKDLSRPGFTFQFARWRRELINAIARDILPFQVDVDLEIATSGTHFLRRLHNINRVARSDLVEVDEERVRVTRDIVKIMERWFPDNPDEAILQLVGYQAGTTRPIYEASTGRDISEVCEIDAGRLFDFIFGDGALDDVEYVLFHVLGVYYLDQAGEVQFLPANKRYEQVLFGPGNESLLKAFKKRVTKAERTQAVQYHYEPKLEAMIARLAREGRDLLPPDSIDSLEAFVIAVNERSPYSVDLANLRPWRALRDPNCRAGILRFLEEQAFWLPRFFNDLFFRYGPRDAEQVVFTHPGSVNLAIVREQERLTDYGSRPDLGVRGFFNRLANRDRDISEGRAHRYHNVWGLMENDLPMFAADPQSPTADAQHGFVSTIYFMRILKELFKKITYDEALDDDAREMYEAFTSGGLIGQDTLLWIQHSLMNRGYQPHPGHEHLAWGAFQYVFVWFGTMYLQEENYGVTNPQLSDGLREYFRKYLGSKRARRVPEGRQIGGEARMIDVDTD